MALAGRAIARFRARGELVDIRAADRRFTPEEAAAYFNEVMALDRAAGELQSLSQGVAR